jgi:hypothetical protein
MAQAHIANEKMAPMGAKIETLVGGATDAAALRHAVEQAGFSADDALKGHFDAIYRGQDGIRVQGWAADTSKENGTERTVQVLVFHCGRSLGLANLGDSRPDVASALGVSDGHSGFNISLHEAHLCGADEVNALVLTADHRYALMSGQVH